MAEEDHQVIGRSRGKKSYGTHLNSLRQACPLVRQAERLRQSILKRAFEGRLVPQDPNDEPAEKLLERIKAEKANREGNKKKRKTK